MLPLHTTPVLLAVLVTILLCLLGWGVARERLPRERLGLVEARDDLLVGLLVLAAFCLGVFLTYLLISIGV